MPRHLARSLATATTSVLLLAAADIPANRHALDEGATFLSSACTIANPGDARTCVNLQNDFLFQYLRAMGGDTLSMSNLAALFSHPLKNEIVANKQRSCAWAILTQLSPDPPDDGSSSSGRIDLYCAGMSANDFTSAKYLASVTHARIERSPTKLPKSSDGDGWPGVDCEKFTVAYAARGQFSPPRCKPRKGPLDSSVAPLVP